MIVSGSGKTSLVEQNKKFEFYNMKAGTLEIIMESELCS